MKYESVRLGDVCRITAGFPFKRNDFCGDSKVIKTGSITAQGVDCQTLPPVSAESYDPKRMMRFLAREGDCVLTMQGPRTEIVKVAMVQQGEAYVNQGVTLLSPGPRLNKDFLFYMLQREEFKQYIKSCLGGHKNLYVRGLALGSYSLQLPPLEEQKAIAHVLRELDERCELNRRIAENLEEQTAVLYHAWFESFEPFGGYMPEAWARVPLRRLTALVDRGVVPEYAATAPYMAVNQKCVRGRSVDLAQARSIAGTSFGRKQLQYGDVLINSTGVGTLGRTAQILFEPGALTADSHITIVRPLRDELRFYLGLWADAHEADFISLQVGSTSQTELPRERVKNMMLVAPDSESLRRFNKIVEPIFAYRASALAEIRQLGELKKSVLSRALQEEKDPQRVVGA